MTTPGYKKRVKAVTKSIELMKSMQLVEPVRTTTLFGVATQPAPVKRSDVVKLASFLLGLDEEQAL